MRWNNRYFLLVFRQGKGCLLDSFDYILRRTQKGEKKQEEKYFLGCIEMYNF